MVSLTLGAMACGPSVAETRMIVAPSKPADCELEFLQLKVEDVSPQGRYEILGTIALSEEGIQDPLAPKYRQIVRPRACGMGGEAVTILLSATATPWALSAGGTTTGYTVVRKRQAPTTTAAPMKF